MCVVRGEPFLGRAIQQGPVAYLFLNGSLSEIADVFVSFGLRESGPLYLHAGSAPGDCIDWLLHTIKQKGVKLVVIDTLQKLLRFKDLNDYAEVTNKIEPVLDAARQGNCHIMMLHHAKKESADDLDAAIGSTAIRGLCYTYLFLKRLPNSERRILRSDQRGGENFSETAIGFNKTTGRIEIQGTMEDAEIEEAAPKILEFVEMEGGDVVEKAVPDALPLGTIIVSKALRQLFRDGKFERTGDGKKGKPFCYSLAADLATVTHSHVTTSSLSIPYREQKNAEKHEQNRKNREKPLLTLTKFCSPETRNRMGTERNRILNRILREQNPILGKANDWNESR